MHQVFTIAPASPKPLWFIAAIAALLLTLLLLFASFVYSSRATRFELSAEGLHIRRTLYGRTIPWDRLMTDQARVVNLRESEEFRPTMRTNGLGLPGYQVGWFRLREGRGLLFVTDPTTVVAIPTHDGYVVLASVADPSAFVRVLQRGPEPSA